MPTIAELLDDAQRRLAPASDSARLDAEVLLAHVLEKPRSHLRAWPEQRVDDTVHARFEALLRRRAQGTPVAHLTGRREFWSLDLQVTPDTLIPRPETELLVELALARGDAQSALRVADLGTGSGAIALAIAHERPRWRVVATDRSAAALAIAHANAERLGLRDVDFRQGDWCEALGDERFDLLVSNPPYIRDDDPHLSAGDVRHEPAGALRSGPGGLEAIERIATQARAHLDPGGWLLIEHGYDQGAEVARMLERLGYRDVRDYRDAAGVDRAARATWT